ncbi:hypothetical protein CVT24_005894 [Panaeolus cyanescens]|uniref:Uncharacterized protein n=1 Tax=Panaeolus cyanescens TaxID=181874 RepID=A0A409WYH9_9AGAR|nr:hypothetical protein CVT24_005894 [Panaeolus cyanescens]
MNVFYPTESAQQISGNQSYEKAGNEYEIAQAGVYKDGWRGGGGLGVQQFAEFEQLVKVAVEKFEQVLGYGKVKGIDSKPFEGYKAYDIGTRYFTDRDDAPTVQHVPFDRELDPNYILEMLRKDRFIHGEDNIVQYCAKINGGEASYVKGRADQFEDGDIVEAHVAFACWPVGRDRYQAGLILRALATINTSFREEADRKMCDMQAKNTQKQRTRKHRDGVDDATIVKRARIVYDMED